MTTPGNDQNPADPNQPHQAPAGAQGQGQQSNPTYGGTHERGDYHAASFNSPSGLRSSSKGFVGALFDINFDNFIALKFAKFIYILVIVLAAVTMFFGWIVPVFVVFSESVGLGMLTLLLGWIPAALFSLFQLIAIRLFLEFVVATIKTSENTSHLLSNTSR